MRITGRGGGTFFSEILFASCHALIEEGEVVVVSLCFATGAGMEAMWACAELWELIGQHERDPTKFPERYLLAAKIREIFLGNRNVFGKYFFYV